MTEAWQGVAWLGTLFSMLHFTLAAILLPHLLLQRKESQATIAWIFALFSIPLLGSLFYWVFGSERMARRAAKQKRLSESARSRIPAATTNALAKRDLLQESPLVRLLDQICEYPYLRSNHVRILTDMEANFRAQLAAIDAAKHHVHLEYYIFRPDTIGARFSRAMIAAVKRGVEVRFVYDAIGGMGLTRAFLDNLASNGVQVACHLPMNLLSRRWLFNFRNHRKILVVDGEIAFLGGANIGEEYLGRSSVGAWLDMHLEIRGPVVQHAQRVFAEDWAFASGEAIEGNAYYPSADHRGDVIAQVVPSGPDLDVAVIHELFFAAINQARQRVRLMTPYFVPTEPLRTALENTSRRGVTVEIMTPGVSTKPFVKLASHAYYDQLLEAGVSMYEFTPGFLHAKMLSIDGEWAFVGTPNFDNRSFRLNFEVGLVMYGEETAVQLDQLFEKYREQSSPIDAELWKKRSVAFRVCESFARLFSPVL